MSLFENYPNYNDYVLAHPPQSHSSLEADYKFKKMMAKAIEEEKKHPKIPVYNREDSGVVFTTNIHLH